MQNLLHLQWAVTTQGCSQTLRVRLFMYNERHWELPWDPETSCLLTLGKPPSRFTVHRCQPASLPSLLPWSYTTSSTQIQNCGHLRMLFDLKLALPIKGFFFKKNIHIVNKTTTKNKQIPCQRYSQAYLCYMGWLNLNIISSRFWDTGPFS